MYLTNKHLSRRTVLKGMGVTLALPFLEAMTPARNAWGASAAAKKVRLVCVEMVHGSAGSSATGWTEPASSQVTGWMPFPIRTSATALTACTNSTGWVCIPRLSTQ